MDDKNTIFSLRNTSQACGWSSPPGDFALTVILASTTICLNLILSLYPSTSI